MLYDSVKPAFYLFKTPRARIGLTRIYLITAHVTLAHATLNNRRLARLKKRRTSYSDRLASSLKNHNIEKNMRSRVFAGKADKKD
jgi:hypothetical protein